VQRNDDGTCTLQWTAPANAREYIVKYGPKPLVETLGFDQVKRRFDIDPGTVMNFWAATNLAGEPTPGTPGTLETYTTPKLPAGDLHFAVKVLTERPGGADEGQTQAGDEAPSSEPGRHAVGRARRGAEAEAPRLPRGHDPHHLWKRRPTSKPGSKER
jgi:hypothetical protein